MLPRNLPHIGIVIGTRSAAGTPLVVHNIGRGPELEDLLLRYSGRVGRSAAAEDLEAKAVELAVRAHVRHAHTPYDRLLAQGESRLDARAKVGPLVDNVLERWTSLRIQVARPNRQL
jgi:hypothetical protein